MLDSKTVSWKTVTILYDSAAMGNGGALKAMIIELQQRISVVMFDISLQPIKEILNINDRIGKNFFVIAKHEMAKKVYELVRMLNQAFKDKHNYTHKFLCYVYR